MCWVSEVCQGGSGSPSGSSPAQQLREFAENRRRDHADRLEITRPAFDKRENLSVWALAQETVNQESWTKIPSPQLVGDLLQAILTGGPYPATLLNGVTLRIRAEREVTGAAPPS